VHTITFVARPSMSQLDIACSMYKLRAVTKPPVDKEGKKV
jgi:hypothetical protein